LDRKDVKGVEGGSLPPKLGPLKIRQSCRITTGGKISENKKIYGGTNAQDSPEVDGSKPVVMAARDYVVSRAMVHRWKARYGGMTMTELKRLKALEEGKKPGLSESWPSRQ
jgi:hypothetical protein